MTINREGVLTAAGAGMSAIGMFLATHFVEPLLATLFGGIGVAAFGSWVAFRYSARLAEERMRRESDGLARAAARSLFNKLMRQYAHFFAARERLKEIRFGPGGGESQRLMVVVENLAVIDSLTPPSELSDPFLNDHLDIDGAVAENTRARSNRFLCTRSGLARLFRPADSRTSGRGSKSLQAFRFSVGVLQPSAL